MKPLMYPAAASTLPRSVVMAALMLAAPTNVKPLGHVLCAAPPVHVSPVHLRKRKNVRITITKNTI